MSRRPNQSRRGGQKRAAPPDASPLAADERLRLQIEKFGLIAALLLYAAVQVNAAFHRGIIGQDFSTYHSQLLLEAIQNPWQSITTVTGWRTNPPLYYLTLAPLVSWAGLPRALETIGLFNAAIGLLGFVAFSRVLRRLISDPILRLACMMLLMFLPFSVIHGMVLAADAPATTMFLVSAWLFTWMSEQTHPRRILALAAAGGLAIILGAATKFTFVSVACAAIVAVSLVAWINRWPRKTAIAAVVLGGLLPLAAAGSELYVYREALRWSHFRSNEPPMSIRSLAFLRDGDAHVLDAPPYNETVAAGHPEQPLPINGDWRPPPGGEFNLLVTDRYSYPALLHLAMFTDSNNFFQNHSPGQYFGSRGLDAQTAMKWSVRAGVVFSLAMLVAVPLVALRSMRRVWKHRDPAAARVLVVLGLALAFYLNIIAFLPSTKGAYGGGYWLPRLVVPSLLVFFSCIFVALDQLPAKTLRIGRWVALAAVVFQSLIHLSFLWMG